MFDCFFSPGVLACPGPIFTPISKFFYIVRVLSCSQRYRSDCNIASTMSIRYICISSAAGSRLKRDVCVCEVQRRIGAVAGNAQPGHESTLRCPLKLIHSSNRGSPPVPQHRDQQCILTLRRHNGINIHVQAVQHYYR